VPIGDRLSRAGTCCSQPLKGQPLQLTSLGLFAQDRDRLLTWQVVLNFAGILTRNQRPMLRRPSANQLVAEVHGLPDLRTLPRIPSATLLFEGSGLRAEGKSEAAHPSRAELAARPLSEDFCRPGPGRDLSWSILRTSCAWCQVSHTPVHHHQSPWMARRRGVCTGRRQGGKGPGFG
jgi:hypothetical protein